MIKKTKLENAEKELPLKKRDKKGFNTKKFSGMLKGVFGDPLNYQKKLRDEW